MSQATLDLAKNKLASSGLTPADAERLGIQPPFEASETAAIDPSFHAAPSLRINYFDPRNPSKPLSARPKWPPFFRIRYLAEVRLKSGKVQRYSQPPDTGVCAYFPTNLEWPAVLDDPNVPIIITEGELKAAKACKEGFPTIGLGGVNSYKNTGLCMGFLRELEAVQWARRRVIVVFDSDITTKPAVAKSMNDLARELELRGALPMSCLLPSEGQQKVGLDDYLLTHSPEQLRNLLSKGSESLTMAAPLWDMNDEAVFVELPGAVYLPHTGIAMNEKQFRSAYANKLAFDQQLDVKASPPTLTFKRANVGEAWLKWPLRATAKQFMFLPGQTPGLVLGPKGHIVLNSWVGWGVEPVRGDVKPFLNLLKSTFKLMEPGAMDWFLRWLAYPIQHPGVKLKTAVLVYSRHQGTGKSFIGDIMRGIYGQEHSVAISNTELTQPFNTWAKDKQFIQANEVLGNDNRSHANTLKNLITDTTIPINDKNIPLYFLNNCTQFYFTTNHLDGIAIEGTDRRFFVVETGEPEAEAFYREVDRWFKADTKAGLAALHHYLKEVVDCSTFNPEANAMVTRTRNKIVSAVRGSVESWCHELVTNPDSVLYLDAMPIHGDLMTSKQLMVIMDRAGANQGNKITPLTLGRHLTGAGLEKANDGSNITVSGITPPQAVYWIVRNKSKWVKASHSECAAHIKKTQGR